MKSNIEKFQRFSKQQKLWQKWNSQLNWIVPKDIVNDIALALKHKSKRSLSSEFDNLLTGEKYSLKNINTQTCHVAQSIKRIQTIISHWIIWNFIFTKWYFKSQNFHIKWNTISLFKIHTYQCIPLNNRWGDKKIQHDFTLWSFDMKWSYSQVTWLIISHDFLSHDFLSHDKNSPFPDQV